MPKLERILVPVDFSDCAHGALEQALFLASHFGSEVEALYMWRRPRYAGSVVRFHMPGADTRELVSEEVAEALRQLEAFVAAHKCPEGVKLSQRLGEGNPVTGILDLLRTEGYDMVVLGTHGRRGLSHFFLGSVAEQVVREAPCPVLTVRLEAAESGQDTD